MKTPLRIGLAVLAIVACLLLTPLQAFFVLFSVTAILARGNYSLGELSIRGIAFDVQMTSFAHGIAPDYTSSLAELMAPQCVAPAAAGHYIAFDDDEAFRFIETRRAIGGDMALIDFPTTSPRFDCEPHALGIPTDRFEEERVGEGGMAMLRESKVRTLVSRNALSREKRVFDKYAAGVSAEGGLGTWTGATVDPIEELDTIVAGLMTQTGMNKVDLVIGLGALRQLRKHPLVQKRFPGASIININGQVLQQLLLQPATVHVAVMPIATEKSGKTAVKSVIGNDKVYALISQPNPSPFDPSAAKTFTTNAGQVQGVGFVDRPPFAEINFIAWSEDIRITGLKCVKRIDVALGAIA